MAKIIVATYCLHCKMPVASELQIEMMSIHQKLDNNGIPMDVARDWSPVGMFACKHCGTVMDGTVQLSVKIHHKYEDIEESERNLQTE